jgi:hypothetical protein
MSSQVRGGGGLGEGGGGGDGFGGIGGGDGCAEGGGAMGGGSGRGDGLGGKLREHKREQNTRGRSEVSSARLVGFPDSAKYKATGRACWDCARPMRRPRSAVGAASGFR